MSQKFHSKETENQVSLLHRSLICFSYPKDLGLLQNNPQPGAHEMCYAGVVAYPVVVDNTSTMFTTQLMLGLWFVTNLALMPWWMWGCWLCSTSLLEFLFRLSFYLLSSECEMNNLCSVSCDFHNLISTSAGAYPNICDLSISKVC